MAKKKYQLVYLREFAVSFLAKDDNDANRQLLRILHKNKGCLMEKLLALKEKRIVQLFGINNNDKEKNYRHKTRMS